VQEHVRSHEWERIGRTEWDQLRAIFPTTSETTVRAALLELPISVDQPFAGIATKTLDDLETSLVHMAATYAADPEIRRECRAQVIAAKDRTRFAVLNPMTPPEKRVVKEEMLEWMLVWLGDPALFATWVALRKRAGYCSSTDST